MPVDSYIWYPKQFGPINLQKDNLAFTSLLVRCLILFNWKSTKGPSISNPLKGAVCKMLWHLAVRLQITTD